MRGLYYFTIDQRFEDNPLLQKAVEECEEICFCAKAPSSQWGYFRQRFAWESLDYLKRTLENNNNTLLILENPLQEISLASFDRVYICKMETAYEKEEYSLGPNELLVTMRTDRLLDSPPTPLPSTFTPFRKIVATSYTPSPFTPTPLQLGKACSLKLKTYESPSLSPFHASSSYPFKGGEHQAKQRLSHYLYRDQLIEHYKETRNGLTGADFSSKLSAYLALGNLSPQAVYREINNFEQTVLANESTYWLKFELWWREYFRWVHDQYPHLFFLNSGIKNPAKQKDQIPNQELFSQWQEGKTPHPFVNAFLREFLATGYMSNRGRQITASYLVNDLKLPWKWGAQYFEDNLVDYDVYSNWGNWLYIAGVGNDPRPNRYFNPDKQQERYDPKGAFRKIWL